MNHITKDETSTPEASEKRKQWVWFIGLWFGGLLAVTILAKIIKIVMNYIYN